ncbi:lytic transglycosylase family protein [Pseudochrobactrum algeriensis]|uniref:Lytic murein transglycosylase n=1 Tax=Pseudochrobactrum saccharolyticum TaxID=354352 RepID=A0A7W8EPG4_9HYPH|nr:MULTISPECIES: lytic transglycosylase domain-containing protein [Pseudochrobactrum]MBX8785383.1 murein transglycosylase [Ochrobactrum sp. GRS2]MBX8814262.1 murein transglycosylase [Ochrobactrum sp. MR34]KAB0537014.1 murein transglycosylase [Pseudochrobactrum saccharolyticum]MBB5092565.1 lytic murein transglycosylase [Pseudochrobactrum saccharolyticum]MDP8250967.1 lytic transglycosylase family protein [Pseudochrobactrum saccharolyticum]
MQSKTIKSSLRQLAIRVIGGSIAVLAVSGVAQAAQCGNTGAGFPAWVQGFKQEAAARGIKGNALSALDNVKYATATINADRNQKSFKLSLDDFMKKRGSTTIINRGKTLKKQNAALFAKIEQRYGVPAGPLLAIWGMETGFGNYLGKQHTLSAVATLAYDCRRSEFFTNELYAALQLIQRGDLSPNAVGAMHGEIGQTQFLPSSVIKFGADGDGNGHIDMVGSRADALASTANFLKAHGWRAGAGYQQGQPNYVAIQGWNAATVYQQAIAIMGQAIDGK